MLPLMKKWTPLLLFRMKGQGLWKYGGMHGVYFCVAYASQHCRKLNYSFAYILSVVCMLSHAAMGINWCTWIIFFVSRKHCVSTYLYLEKKKDIWLSGMTTAIIQTENLKIKKTIEHTKTPRKNLDFTKIADRFKTFSWSNNSLPSDVLKPVYG